MIDSTMLTISKKFWKDKKIAILGASFIGSHLADKLIELGVKKIKIANLTNKNKHYFNQYIRKNLVDFYEMDLRDLDHARLAVKDADIVFHLAADHGGRGYVDTHQGATASNFLLDGSIFKACLEEKAKVVFASSGCVYPNYLQRDPDEEVHLKEGDVGSVFEPDNMYGHAKLGGELVLKAYYKDYGLKSAICRYFTVYGPRGVENHAVIALIAKAFLRQDPYEIWGDGKQIRNWSYIDDIVEGTILVAEKINNARAVNLGTMERTTVNEAVKMIFDYIDWTPKRLDYLKDMPVGPVNRVADNSLAKKLLNWEPKVKFKDGLKRTIDWYFKNKKTEEVEKDFERKLLEK